MNVQHRTSNVQHRIKKTESPRYVLGSGTQVRDEDFGLLFYTMKGPRLYFLSSGPLMDSSFFQGEISLDEWMRFKLKESVPEERIGGIKKSLHQLKDKGVIVEC